MDDAKDRSSFLMNLKKAGVDGGIIISLPPVSFSQKASSFEKRLDNLFFWTGSIPNLYPFYWIDPMEDNALKQVETAVERGIKGFKIICDSYYVYDKRVLKTVRAAARLNKPVLFHSGILWDGKNSSKYNHPVSFEALLEISGLKFSLAHIAWPWCDELIAVYGKFQDARKWDSSAEMFIDITPGTPPVYRREVLTKLFTAGYNVKDNIIFGSDCTTGEYDFKWTKKWLSLDGDIFRELNTPQETFDRIYNKNLKRFTEIS